MPTDAAFGGSFQRSNVRAQLQHGHDNPCPVMLAPHLPHLCILLAKGKTEASTAPLAWP